MNSQAVTEVADVFPSSSTIPGATFAQDEASRESIRAASRASKVEHDRGNPKS